MTRIKKEDKDLENPKGTTASKGNCLPCFVLAVTDLVVLDNLSAADGFGLTKLRAGDADLSAYTERSP